jgi:hypothetical protein
VILPALGAPNQLRAEARIAGRKELKKWEQLAHWKNAAQLSVVVLQTLQRVLPNFFLKGVPFLDDSDWDVVGTVLGDTSGKRDRL